MCLSPAFFVEITDNHFHLDPLGRREMAVKDFISAGGTRLVLVHKPYKDWNKLSSFKNQVDTTLSLASKARHVGAKVAVVASPHPVQLLKLLEKQGKDAASEIYLDAVNYCTELVDENKIVGLGELGRPHFKVKPSIWRLSNEILVESLSRAREVDAAAVLHTESADSSVMAELSNIATKSGFPKSRLVKHYGSLESLEDQQEIVVSLISSFSNIEGGVKRGKSFMLETDYLDDPNRPGAVMGPKTVPRKTLKALNTGLLNQDQLHKIHTDLPNQVYREFI